VNKARPFLPTDLLALVTYNGHSYRNEAWARERVGADESSGSPLGTILEQFLSLRRHRSASISVRRQHLRGLVACRPRGGRQAWEVDYLIDATAQHDAIPGLLESAISDAARGGAEKLFLRLEADSDLVDVVREAGFLPYREETLYVRTELPRLGSLGASIRPMTPADSYLAFRLYNHTFPELVRRTEAATYGEWQAAQERRWLKNGIRLVLEEDGSMRGVVAGARLSQGVSFDLLADDETASRAANLVSTAGETLDAGNDRASVLLPTCIGGVAGSLTEAGFEAERDYVCLMRRTTRPISIPKLRPAIAETAIGV